MLTSDAYPYREEHGPVDDISRLPTLELSPSAATHAVGFLGVSNMHKSQLSGLRLKAQPFNHSCPQDLMGRGGVSLEPADTSVDGAFGGTCCGDV